MAAIAAAIAPAAAAAAVDPFDAIVDPEIFDKARVCKKTKRRYLKRRTKFKAWCAAKYPDWYDAVSGEVDLVALVPEALASWRWPRLAVEGAQNPRP